MHCNLIRFLLRPIAFEQYKPQVGMAINLAPDCMIALYSASEHTEGLAPVSINAIYLFLFIIVIIFGESMIFFPSPLILSLLTCFTIVLTFLLPTEFFPLTSILSAWPVTTGLSVSLLFSLKVGEILSSSSYHSLFPYHVYHFPFHL